MILSIEAANCLIVNPLAVLDILRLSLKGAMIIIGFCFIQIGFKKIGIFKA